MVGKKKKKKKIKNITVQDLKNLWLRHSCSIPVDVLFELKLSLLPKCRCQESQNVLHSHENF